VLACPFAAESLAAAGPCFYAFEHPVFAPRGKILVVYKQQPHLRSARRAHELI
jgi:hypothetical protein